LAITAARPRIGEILRRQRRDRHHRVGQAHALAAGDFAADFDAGNDALRVGLRRGQP